MKNKHQPAIPFDETAIPPSKPDIAKLPKMEMYAVLGLELSKQILEKVKAMEDSLEILAAQKARELQADSEPDAKPE